MPAAAVIPAPVAYAKVAAVKKLIVGSHGRNGGPLKVSTSAVVGQCTRYAWSPRFACVCPVVNCPSPARDSRWFARDALSCTGVPSDRHVHFE